VSDKIVNASGFSAGRRINQAVAFYSVSVILCCAVSRKKRTAIPVCLS